jgi:hypothetical protein
MALGDEVETGNKDPPGDDNSSKVSLSNDKLAAQVNSLTDALISQDKLPRLAKTTLGELEFAKGAWKSYSVLQSELVEKNAKISAL